MANLLDVDASILNTATLGERGMALFFDFAAASPSVEHAFVIKFFQHLGWPDCLIRISRFYIWITHALYAWAVLVSKASTYRGVYAREAHSDLYYLLWPQISC